jgi:hypothetical protein
MRPLGLSSEAVATRKGAHEEESDEKSAPFLEHIEMAAARIAPVNRW